MFIDKLIKVQKCACESERGRNYYSTSLDCNVKNLPLATTSHVLCYILCTKSLALLSFSRIEACASWCHDKMSRYVRCVPIALLEIDKNLVQTTHVVERLQVDEMNAQCHVATPCPFLVLTSVAAHGTLPACARARA